MLTCFAEAFKKFGEQTDPQILNDYANKNDPKKKPHERMFTKDALMLPLNVVKYFNENTTTNSKYTMSRIPNKQLSPEKIQ